MYDNSNRKAGTFYEEKAQKKIKKKNIIKHRIILTTSFLSLTFILATGYSAFSTNLTLNTKGNIKELTADQSGLGWLSGYYFDHAYAVKPIQHQNRR